MKELVEHIKFTNKLLLFIAGQISIQNGSLYAKMNIMKEIESQVNTLKDELKRLDNDLPF